MEGTHQARPSFPRAGVFSRFPPDVRVARGRVVAVGQSLRRNGHHTRASSWCDDGARNVVPPAWFWRKRSGYVAPLRIARFESLRCASLSASAVGDDLPYR